jgi:hypothetical protein
VDQQDAFGRDGRRGPVGGEAGVGPGAKARPTGSRGSSPGSDASGNYMILGQRPLEWTEVCEMPLKPVPVAGVGNRAAAREQRDA